MKRNRAVYEQRFHVRHTEIAIGYPEGSVSIACGNLSKSCMQKLMNELVCHRKRAGRYDLPA